MASFVKVWAIAIALGGSFNSLKMFEKGLLQGEIRAMAREVIYIICAMAGANCGSYVFKFVPVLGIYCHEEKPRLYIIFRAF